MPMPRRLVARSPSWGRRIQASAPLDSERRWLFLAGDVAEEAKAEWLARGALDQILCVPSGTYRCANYPNLFLHGPSARHADDATRNTIDVRR